MDRATRNETIRALAAATAAAIRIRPARSLAAVSGEIVCSTEPELRAVPRCTDRELPIENAKTRENGGSA